MTTNSPAVDNGVSLLAAWLAGNASGLQSAVNKLATMTVTITSDDTPNVSVSASTESEAA